MTRLLICSALLFVSASRLWGVSLPDSVVSLSGDTVLSVGSLAAQPAGVVADSLPAKTAMPPGNTMDGAASGVPSHSFRTDVTWAGLPWIAAGIALRGEKKNFREVRNKFTYQFHHTADDYSQHIPLLLTTGLKVAGYEGRSGRDRYLVSAFASYAVMAALVNSVKYSARELRPDGSTYNSFPSGHTATAFAAATILHKEYGLTRSMWFSVAGYTLATATGCMRVLNNRHWVSDVFAGAGIGILSTELGYALGDLLFGGRGLLRPDRRGMNDLKAHPSFFSVQMGMGLGTQSLDFAAKIPATGAYYDQEPVKRLRFSRATVVGVEGAYFPTPHVGIGGRLRVATRLVKNWRELAQSPVEGLLEFSPQLEGFLDMYRMEVKSDHFSDFTLSAGPYFHFPLSSRLSIDTKLLIGHAYTRGINIDATVRGRQRDIDLSYETENGVRFLVCEVKGGKGDNGAAYESSWDYLSVDVGNSFTVGTGLALTLAHKSSMAWRLFADYDFSRRRYTVAYAPIAFVGAAARRLTLDGQPVDAADYTKPYTVRMKKGISNFVVGGSFCVSF